MNPNDVAEQHYHVLEQAVLGDDSNDELDESPGEFHNVASPLRLSGSISHSSLHFGGDECSTQASQKGAEGERPGQLGEDGGGSGDFEEGDDCDDDNTPPSSAIVSVFVLAFLASGAHHFVDLLRQSSEKYPDSHEIIRTGASSPAQDTHNWPHLNICFTLSSKITVDDAVVLPSLWAYIQGMRNSSVNNGNKCMTVIKRA